LQPFGKSSGDLLDMRERLEDIMWDDVGIIRDPDRMKRARQSLVDLENELAETGVAASDRTFNLTWHDWLNLDSLILVSKAITEAALARENSRGAHYREDFPEEGDLETSFFTTARLNGSTIEVGTAPVEFSRVRPGDTLIREEAETAVA
jgi:fumarate reductase flavoprotein subunit